MASFELWETRSGNLMGSFDSEQEALAVLTDALSVYGATYADSIALVRESGRGRSRTIAEGADLAARAVKATSGSRQVPA